MFNAPEGKTMLDYRTILVDAHRPAMDAANKTSLPMTVFYHRDYGFCWTATGSKVLREKETKLHVTWLPDNYFV